MRDPDFPDDLCSFMQECTPSMEAVELLLLLARNPGRGWAPAELARALHPTVVTEQAARESLNGYVSCGLVERRPEGLYVYSQPPPHMSHIIAALEKAYNERPVSLVRLIYALKDKKIRSFADAFKLRMR
jgi:hypothetical protein